MTMRLLRPIESIEPVRAANRFFSGKISLVDVRSEREYRAVHIPGATHIPLPQLRRRVREIRTDRPVALLCRSGHRSALATLIARRHGLEAMNVARGMRAWLGEGRPAVWPSEMTPEQRFTILRACAAEHSGPSASSKGGEANHGAQPVVIPDSLEPLSPHGGR